MDPIDKALRDFLLRHDTQEGIDPTYNGDLAYSWLTKDGDVLFFLSNETKSPDKPYFPCVWFASNLDKPPEGWTIDTFRRAVAWRLAEQTNVVVDMRDSKGCVVPLTLPARPVIGAMEF